MRYLTILAIFLICLIGCNIEPVQETVPKDIEITETDTKIVETDNLFNVKNATVGDIVAGMRIESIDLGDYGKENYSAYIEFSGGAILEGKYVNNTDDEFLGDEVSFIVDGEFSHVLPKLEHDERYLWFVFSNTQKANEVFAPEGSDGKAKVLIKNYEINYAPTEVWNLAELVEVIEFKEDN